MSMRLREIVLYGKNGEIRRLPFNLDGVTVIVGGRWRGKTALMGIVDYCLGSSRCRVRRGAIRRAVAWYGVVFQVDDTQVFVARANPAPGEKTSEEIYIEIAQQVQLPAVHELHSNTNTEGLVSFLSRLSGIAANLHEPELHEYGTPYDVTIRHASFFLYQQQDEIDQSGLLFHRQGERDQNIPRTLRETIPFFLGAVELDRLKKQHELRRHRMQLLEEERRLREQEMVRGRGLSLARALLAEAREVGLVGPVEVERAAEPIALLRAVGAGSQDPTGAIGEELGDTLPALQARQQELTEQYRRVRDELKAARSFAERQSAYGGEVAEQAARLASVRIFPRRESDGSHCPLCTSVLENPVPMVADLESALNRLNDQLTLVTDRRPLLESFVHQLEMEAGRVRREISDTQLAVDQVMALNERERAAQLLESRQSHVLGRLSLYLESLSREPPELLSPSADIEELRRRIDELTEEIYGVATLSRIDSILRLIGKQMSQWADQLELEYRDIRLDLKQLTVVADTTEGPIPMPEMGGGANWLGYHLVSHLALHKYFVEHDRPVPRFLFLDQPSQGSFPSEMADDNTPDAQENEDRRVVHDTFRFIFSVAKELQGRLQIIITDHADLNEPWYQEAVMRPKWFGDEKLVPIHWPGASAIDGGAEEDMDDLDEDGQAGEWNTARSDG